MESAAAHQGSYERGDPTRFTGEVWMLRVPLAADGTETVVVHFSVGARTHWHMHPGGQLLIVQSGRGRVVPRGGQGQLLVPGDIVYAPPGEWHCHGGGSDSPMAHVAVNLAVNIAGPSIWGDPVTDEEYGEIL